MDRKLKQDIEDFAHAITIGCGRAEEILEEAGEPQQDDLDALKRHLGRKPTPEEHTVFINEFYRCLQRAAQP